jgi:hypothetical protein
LVNRMAVPCNGPEADRSKTCGSGRCLAERLLRRTEPCRLGPMLVMLCTVVSCRSTTPRVSDCAFPAPPRSTIAWGLPADSGFSGHVLNVGSGEPMQDAIVQLEPGGHIVQSDSTGAFRFAGVKRQRYYMRVLALGFHTAQDSVTVSEFGLAVVAVLAPYTPDLLACVRPGTRPDAPQRQGLAAGDSRIS